MERIPGGKKCPACDVANAPENTHCRNCGRTLVDASRFSNQARISQNQPDKRYPALRAIASTLQLFATLAIVAGILTFIIATIAAGAVGFFMSVVVGGLFFGLLWIGLKSYSELIYVQIDIEENTRRTAEILASSKGGGQ